MGDQTVLPFSYMYICAKIIFRYINALVFVHKCVLLLCVSIAMKLNKIV